MINMKNFKNYFEEKNVVGLVEFFDLDGVGKVPAKLDSGNGAFNVLHGEDIQEPVSYTHLTLPTTPYV